MGVNLSRAAEAGIVAALETARVEAWQRENAEGMAAANAFFEAPGCPWRGAGCSDLAATFDVGRLVNGPLVMVLQAAFLDHLATRVVAPPIPGARPGPR